MELTFGSDASNFIEGTSDVLLGTFQISSQNSFGVATLNIKWDFSDTYATKLINGSGDPVTNGTFIDLSYSQPLPVEFSSISASVNSNNNVNINRKTATEVNNNGFEMQREIRSQNSENQWSAQWEEIGFVQRHGNSNSPKEYSFTDKNLTGALILYAG